MVTYAIKTFNADPSKIFVTGSSSGGMMTNVLASAYPDMFAAASVLSGVPAGCFASPSGGVEQWNETCSEGKSIASAELWTSTAENMDPGYASKRPKIQLWHGMNDTIIAPQNLVEEIKQSTGVFGVSETATNVTTDSPLKGYTTSFYGEDVVAISAEGVGHPVPVDEVAVLNWFGIY
jgi:acetylxylan esterase